MVRLDFATVLLAVATVSQAVKQNTPAIVPGAYIVEYENDQVSHGQDETRSSETSLQTFLP